MRPNIAATSCRDIIEYEAALVTERNSMQRRLKYQRYCNRVVGGNIGEDFMTAKNNRLHQTQRIYFENLCNGLRASLPKDDVAELVLDRGIALLKQTCSSDDAGEPVAV